MTTTPATPDLPACEIDEGGCGAAAGVECLPYCGQTAGAVDTDDEQDADEAAGLIVRR